MPTLRRLADDLVKKIHAETDKCETMIDCADMRITELERQVAMLSAPTTQSGQQMQEDIDRALSEPSDRWLRITMTTMRKHIENLERHNTIMLEALEEIKTHGALDGYEHGSEIAREALENVSKS